MNSLNLSDECGAVISEAGSGKTKYILTHLNNVANSQPRTLRCLYVAPIKVLDRDTPHQISLYSKFTYCGLRSKKWADANIYGINPDRVVAKFKEVLALVKNNSRDMWVLVVDESARDYRSHLSKRFKALAKILFLFEKRYIMTATLTANNLLSLWSQMYIVDLGKSLGCNFYRYRARFFYNAIPEFHVWKPMEASKEEIYSIIKPLLYYEKIDDLHYPTLHEIHVSVLHGDEVYASEKKLINCWDYLDFFVPLSQPKKRSLNRQLASGVAYMDSIVPAEAGDLLNTIHVRKNKKLLDLVRQHVGKVLVTYYYKKEGDMIQEYLALAGYEVLRVSDVGDAIGNWIAGAGDVLLSQVYPVSHGVNIQHRTEAIVLYSLFDDYEVYYQLQKRVHRRGSAFSDVFVYTLLGGFKIEKSILKRISTKYKDMSELRELF